MRRWLPLAMALLAVPAAAQVVPQPSLENPRIQTVTFVDGERVVVTVLPKTAVTVMLEPGEQIARVTLDNQRTFEVQVSAERDSLLIQPQYDDSQGLVRVETDRRAYDLDVRTGDGLMAAYLVRFDHGARVAPVVLAREWTEPGSETWLYRMKGDRSVLPDSISDDGQRTRILFAEERALPAVFAIGPTGEEQLVNGYMRDGLYVIDRVWDELVFRLDKEKATARRNAGPEKSDG